MSPPNPTPARERIAALLYEAWPERGPLTTAPWPEMMARKQAPWLAMADAVLAAGAERPYCDDFGMGAPCLNLVEHGYCAEHDPAAQLATTTARVGALEAILRHLHEGLRRAAEAMTGAGG